MDAAVRGTIHEPVVNAVSCHIIGSPTWLLDGLDRKVATANGQTFRTPFQRPVSDAVTLQDQTALSCRIVTDDQFLCGAVIRSGD